MTTGLSSDDAITGIAGVCRAACVHSAAPLQPCGVPCAAPRAILSLCEMSGLPRTGPRMSGQHTGIQKCVAYGKEVGRRSGVLGAPMQMWTSFCLQSGLIRAPL